MRVSKFQKKGGNYLREDTIDKEIRYFNSKNKWETIQGRQLFKRGYYLRQVE